MLTLFDLMRGTQGQPHLDALSRQFALSREQTQQTIAALAPAFALGLQRTMMDPAAMMRFWGLLASGQFSAFADPARAATPQGTAEGHQALGALFGSQELNRQIVHQVATVTGVATEVIRQMLPVLAAMMIGTLARTMEGAGWSQPLEATRALDPAPTPNVADFWADMIKGMFGSAAVSGGLSGSPAQPSGQAAAGSAPPAPHVQDVMQFFKPVSPAPQEPVEPPMPDEAPAPRTAAAKAAPKNFGTGAKVSGDPARPSPGKAGRSAGAARQKADEKGPARAEDPAQLWGQIMQTSSDIGQQHIANLQDLFTAYWGTDGRNR